MGTVVSASLALSPNPATCWVTDQCTVLASMINKMALTIYFALMLQIRFRRVPVNIFTHLDERTQTGNKSVSPIEATTRREQVEGTEVGEISGVGVT